VLKRPGRHEFRGGKVVCVYREIWRYLQEGNGETDFPWMLDEKQLRDFCNPRTEEWAAFCFERERQFGGVIHSASPVQTSHRSGVIRQGVDVTNSRTSRHNPHASPIIIVDDSEQRLELAEKSATEVEMMNAASDPQLDPAARSCSTPVFPGEGTVLTALLHPAVPD